METIEDLKKSCLSRLERMDKLIEQYEAVAYQELVFVEGEAVPGRTTSQYFARMDEFNVLMKQFIEHADFIRRIEALKLKDTGLDDTKDELYHMLKHLPSDKVEVLMGLIANVARSPN